jgi:hypothetical protein
MVSLISATTARDRLPVAVSLNPRLSAARPNKVRAPRTTADPESSAGARPGSSRITLLAADGSSFKAIKLS